MGKGRFTFSWTRNSLAGFNEFRDSRAQDFGTLTLTYLLPRGEQQAGTGRSTL